MPLKVFNDGRSGFRFNWPERRLRMRSLYTNDAAEAEKRAAELRAGMKADEFKRKYANAPKTTTNGQTLSDRMAKYRTEAPPIETPSTPENATLEEVLSKVAEQRLGDVPPSSESQPSSPPITPEQPDETVEDANAEWDNGIDTSDKPQRAKRAFKGLGKKIASGLAQANMMGLAFGVKVFGTNKKYVMHVAPASDESVAVTAEGIEMWIDETLVNHPPKWYHLWAAGNAMMLASIISQAERHERGKEPDPTVSAGPPMPETATS